MKNRMSVFGVLVGLGWPTAAPLAQSNTPAMKPMAKMETVAQFNGPMPTGVTVSHSGRVFVNFPRWGDNVTASVVELKNGKEIPFPDAALNTLDANDMEHHLVSVQSVVVDPKDRLWILDTGSIQFLPTKPGGPKLIGVDLATNKVFKTILFPSDVALPTTYLNDIRFNLTLGTGGVAFITDSSDQGPNGIIVVDLATGNAMRRLNDHPSTKAEPGFLPIVEGEPLMQRAPGKPPKNLTMGSDGIAISADGKRLFYCPLSSRRLYSVSSEALADPAQSDAQVAETVTDHGEKGASDGLETDSQSRIYATNYEHRAILRRSPDGTFETFLQDNRLVWPDTLSVAANGYLYFINNQLNRQARYHNGKDLRRKPYTLYRARIDAGPIAQK